MNTCSLLLVHLRNIKNVLQWIYIITFVLWGLSTPCVLSPLCFSEIGTASGNVNLGGLFSASFLIPHEILFKFSERGLIVWAPLPSRPFFLHLSELPPGPLSGPILFPSRRRKVLFFISNPPQFSPCFPSDKIFWCKIATSVELPYWYDCIMCKYFIYRLFFSVLSCFFCFVFYKRYSVRR